jgi:hypothetical protein
LHRTTTTTATATALHELHYSTTTTALHHATSSSCGEGAAATIAATPKTSATALCGTTGSTFFNMEIKISFVFYRICLCLYYTSFCSLFFNIHLKLYIYINIRLYIDLWLKQKHLKIYDYCRLWGGKREEMP